MTADQIPDPEVASPTQHYARWPFGLCWRLAWRVEGVPGVTGYVGYAIDPELIPAAKQKFAEWLAANPGARVVH